MSEKSYTFTRSQMVSGIAVIFALLAVVVPRTVEAVTGSAVNITDPTTVANKAKVSPQGALFTAICPGGTCAAVDTAHKLAVGDGSGPLTVDGSVQTRPTSPYSNNASASVSNDNYPHVYIPASTKTLGIQTASIFAAIPSGESVLYALIRVVTKGVSSTFYFHLDYQGTYTNNYAYYGTMTPMVAYADPGSSVYCEIFRSGYSSNANIDCAVSGYLF
jgi:hypothetical protein